MAVDLTPQRPGGDPTPAVPRRGDPRRQGQDHRGPQPGPQDATGEGP